MNPVYNIDFVKLITWLVPPRLRDEFTLNWLKSLVLPITLLYNDWRNYYNDVNYRLNITGQVCKLEGVLNDAFDSVERRITITDTQENTVILIHTDEAQNPLITHQEGQGQYYDNIIPIIHDNSAYIDSIYDFNVNVPVQLGINQKNRLINILNTYKLASKHYKIL